VGVGVGAAAAGKRDGLVIRGSDGGAPWYTTVTHGLNDQKLAKYLVTTPTRRTHGHQTGAGLFFSRCQTVGGGQAWRSRRFGELLR
jgi:hypothetical protein